MKIGFVAEPYEESNASGMGYVVIEFIKNLVAQNTNDEYVVYSSKPINRDLIPGTFVNTIIPAGFVKQFFYFIRLQDRLDVLLFIAPLLPLWLPRRIKAVMVCQELGSQKIRPGGVKDALRSFLRDRLLMPTSVARAAKIIAASEATQKDLLQYYRVAKEKVPVIYDGFQDLSHFADSATPIDQRMTPYLFFAGKVKPRKNVHGIVAAFIVLQKRRPSDLKLIIGGDFGGQYHQDMVTELNRAGLQAQVFFVGYVTGATLYSYYKNARGFVFPSINEGFGMPPIEAMSMGVPVLTSKISSMAEVAGGAALLVDPFDIEDISQAMEKLAFDESVRSDLIAKGYDRAKVFSWPLAAKQCTELLHSLT
jgi:glycosyltransferase involved in cell wall biosynthesis